MKDEAAILKRLEEEEHKLVQLDMKLVDPSEWGFGSLWVGREFLDQLCHQTRIVNILRWVMDLA